MLDIFGELGEFESIGEFFESFGFLLTLGKIILVLVAALIVLRILRRIISRAVGRNQAMKESPRAITMAKVLSSSSRYAVYFIAIMVILSLLGIDIMPVLASAGVLGLALGIGAQSLVKDIITGFFIIFDNYFSVGDYIEACGVTGFVEELGLRSTKIRDWAGEVHIFPNGEILRVTNYSRGKLSVFMDIPIAYSGNLEAALEAIERACRSMKGEFPSLSEGPVILGLDDLGKERMTIKVYFKTAVENRFALTRELRKRAKQNLDAAGVEVAPHYRIMMEGEAREESWEKA